MKGPRRRWTAWLALGAIGAALAWWGAARPDASQLLADAQAHFQSGRYAEAQAELDRLGRLRLPVAMDRMARAQVALAQGRYEDALAEAEAIFDDPALGPMAHLLAGEVELERSRLRPAEAHFREAADRLPGEAQPHERLAYIYNMQHRWADFDREMLTLSDRGALSYNRLVHWGKARQATWDPLEDSERLARCVAADPEDRASRLVLAEALRRQNRLDQVDDVLAPLPPDDPEAAALRAFQALDRGRVDEVEDLIRHAPIDHPAIAEVRARLALNRGDAAAAVEGFERAREASPYDRGLLQGLASALKLAGREEEAASYWRAVDRYDAITPLIMRAATAAGAADPDLPARLGEACAAAGRISEAIAWYRRALAGNPLDRDLQRRLFEMERQRPHG